MIIMEYSQLEEKVIHELNIALNRMKSDLSSTLITEDFKYKLVNILFDTTKEILELEECD